MNSETTFAIVAIALVLLLYCCSNNISLGYAQPIEESWLNVPSHAVNGEIELRIKINNFMSQIQGEVAENTPWYKPFPVNKTIAPSPNLTSQQISFDIQNVTGGIKIVNTTSFTFSPDNGTAWYGEARVSVDNKTLDKIFSLELDPYPVEPLYLSDGSTVYSDEGTLTIGANTWVPIWGYVLTVGDNAPYELYLFSTVDHIPDQSNNGPMIQ